MVVMWVVKYNVLPDPEARAKYNDWVLKAHEVFFTVPGLLDEFKVYDVAGGTPSMATTFKFGGGYPAYTDWLIVPKVKAHLDDLKTLIYGEDKEFWEEWP